MIRRAQSNDSFAHLSFRAFEGGGRVAHAATRTLSASVCICLYRHGSNIGWVLFGTASDLFATWTLSFITMTRIALGEFDSIYPELFAINNPAGFLIIITYQVSTVARNVTQDRSCQWIVGKECLDLER